MTVPAAACTCLSFADVRRGQLFRDARLVHAIRGSSRQQKVDDVLSVAGFDYSAAMRERGEVWDYDALNSFLARPFEYLPGTKMAIIGISDADERADLMAYMRTLSDTPAPLP